jgi:hypothetical protein
MSTQPAPPSPAPRPANEVRLYSHSHLFYWWPVWAVALILGLLTMTQGTRSITVPEGTRAFPTVIAKDAKGTEVAVGPGFVLPEKAGFVEKDKDGNPVEPKLHVTSRKSYGVLFMILLVLVIVITNVPLRGMWSVLIIMMIVLGSIIFALAGWWDNIINALSLLDIRITQGGYIFLGVALLGAWLTTFFIFDRQIYITFQPGMMKVCMEVGSGEKAYDTVGMNIEKQRSDLFRHWILGLGSGDLIVKTSGAERHEFLLHNVLFVGRKLKLIEEMQRVRQERAV